MSVIERLRALDIELPQPLAPVANYVPFMRDGNLVHISGQLSMDKHGGVRGVVGDEVDIELAAHGARLCGINLIAQFRAACDGDLGRVQQVLRLGGFVRTHGAFDRIPQVMNGCSDLMVEVFGDAGRHARSAVGVYQLPMGHAVEVEALIRIAD
ncbi:hypothetical protein GCM10011349_44310 [Novosphingobium indicum]|uniref:Endoribonuclease L-PSP/chorismate mutase-like domain-containing protein n=1 Tax=Novosphingobium indicum TaxID=462949 RepID=A0ABQ2K1X9_9SPHN|nr:RidA family protein [Novosphingobium indicum]GGN61554.1 hypothetical protein GCM10011349_44310 [Novosphingobium indicum]